MTRCRAREWSKYNRSLVKQGSIIFWIQQGSLKGWRTDPVGGMGRPLVYSRHAILAAMIVRCVFGVAFRQLQGLFEDLLPLIAKGLPCPNYTTICRRARTLKPPLQRVPFKVRKTGPVHVVFDSTGLRVYGEGEWQIKKHGPSYRRGWKKVHVGMCAETQQIVVASLSDKDFSDSHAMIQLLNHIPGQVAEVVEDGAYDCHGCYEAIHQRGARAIIPPRRGARKSRGDPVLADRDRAIHRIRDQKRGKRRWKEEADYHRRSLVETAMHRLKTVTGSGIRARHPDSQSAEMSVRIMILSEMMAMK